ncbi:MAG TPA: MerR family transcriptional regulator [Actinobacteria bacterium]|jgi:DNA-binding transcriptional MerR regulator|nr:MerR family transcriptional regulator [Actinomycetota bacterium]
MNKYLKQKSIENRSFTNFDIKTPPQEKNIYGSRDVCKITGLTYKQLDYYDRTDFLSPSVNQAVGYGSKRMYSFNDLLKLKVVKSLLDAGISLHKIRKTKKYLELDGNGEDAFLKVTLISDGNTVFACYSDKEIIDTINNGQAVFGIALEKVYNNLKDDVEDFLRKASRSEKEM